MNTLILKDERGAVETVPSYEGIATLLIPRDIPHGQLVETVPSYEGIATFLKTSDERIATKS